jgi:hypothetical protein
MNGLTKTGLRRAGSRRAAFPTVRVTAGSCPRHGRLERCRPFSSASLDGVRSTNQSL